MKRQHVLLGLSIVLVICLAAPALGEPLGSRAKGLKSVKAMAKKALKAADAAQAAANSAQSAANAAKAAATTADTTAKAAGAAAKTAGDAANGANVTAKAATTAANAATTAANAAGGTAQTALNTANAAGQSAGSRYGFRKVVRVKEKAEGLFTFEAFCPAGTTLTGGGVAIPTGFPVIKASGPNVGDDGWAVTVSAGGNEVEVIAIAICVSPNPIP